MRLGEREAQCLLPRNTHQTSMHTASSVDFCPCISALVQGSADPGWAWQARSVVCGHLRAG